MQIVCEHVKNIKIKNCYFRVWGEKKFIDEHTNKPPRWFSKYS